MSGRRWLAGAASVVLVAAAVVAGPKEAAADDLVTVDPGVRYQSIDGWGTSLAWWAESTGGWRSDKAKNDLADAIFSPTEGLGLNIVRYDIGARGWLDVCAATQRTGAAVPSFEWAPGMWDWSRDPNQRWMLQAAKDRGADRFEAIAYSAPSWMTPNYCSSGAVIPGADNLSSADYGRYTDYLATVVKHFHDEEGITFGTVDPFNEPADNPWRFGGNQQGMNLSRSAQNTLIGNLQQSLAAAGAGYAAISAPDEWSVAGTIRDIQSYSAASRDALAQINTHNYQPGQDEGALYRLGQQTGKPVWMSEWGNNGDLNDATGLNSAIQLSQQILLNEQQLHPAAWSIWQAADGGPLPTSGKCNDLWGLVCTNIERNSNEKVTLPKRYFAMGNYSKFVRPGYRMIDDSDPNTFTAYDEDAGSLVLVVTNPGQAAKNVTYDLSGVAGMDSAVATPHLTDATHDLTTESGVAVSNGKLSVSLPSRSVTTYVLKGAGGGPGASRGKLAAVQFGQQMQVFGRGTNGHAYSDVWTPGDGWSGWQDLGGNLVSDLSAVRFGEQMQVFGRGANGHGYSDVWTPGAGWSGWQDLGGELVGDLSAVQFGQQMQVFGRGTNGHGYSDVWTPGAGWSGWQDLGGELVGDLSAVQFGEQMQVFGRGTNDHAYSDVWTPGTGWSGWQDLGGELVSDPSAVRFGQQMQVFGRGTDGHAYSDVWTSGTGWSGWQHLGGELVGNLSAVQFGQQMQVFGRGANNHTYSNVWTSGTGWSGWQDLGGKLAGNPTATQFGEQMQVFGVASNRDAYTDVWTPGTGWAGWQDLGGTFA